MGVSPGDSIGLMPDTEQLPSNLDKQQRADIAQRHGRSVTEHTTAQSGVKIWDTVYEMWTNPLPRENLQAYHLRKEVWRCSACHYTSIEDNGVKRHIPVILERARAHETAEPMDSISERGDHRIRCNRCEATFSRYTEAQRHITEAVGRAKPHERGVTARRQRRFVWGPDEPHVLEEVLVNGTGEMGADGSRTERSQRHRGGRRRRRQRNRR